MSTRLFAWFLGCVLLACSGPAPAPDQKAPASAPAPADSAASQKSTSAPAGKQLGDACEPKSFLSGCPAGTLCTPNGVCTAMKAFGHPCPAPNRWVESPRGGEVCVRSCDSDDDCAPGVPCDVKGWGACIPPGSAAPKAPACKEAPLVKKTFGPSKQVSTAKGPGSSNIEPSAALLPTGDVVAAYIGLGGMTQDNTLGLVKVSGETVDGDRTFTSDRKRHMDPWMSSDRKGNLYLVWLGFNAAAPDRDAIIGFSSSTDGVTWSPSKAIHDAPHDCTNNAPGCLDKPMIAAGPQKEDPSQDAIYVAYFSEIAEGLKVVRSLDGGATFSESVKAGDGAYGDIEVDPQGGVHIVYMTSTEGLDSDKEPNARFGSTYNFIAYTRSDDGGKSFSAPVAVSEPGQSVPFFFSNPQVVADTKNKRLYVVYPAGSPDGRWDIFLATSNDEGKSWSRIRVNDDAPCANHMTPTAVLDPKTSEVHIVWTENRSGFGAVAYARCAAGGGSCSANEAVSDAPSASYSLGRWSATWQGEYYPLVFDEKRRILHMFYTLSVQEGDTPTSRIFYASAKL